MAPNVSNSRDFNVWHFPLYCYKTIFDLSPFLLTILPTIFLSNCVQYNIVFYRHTNLHQRPHFALLSHYIGTPLHAPLPPLNNANFQQLQTPRYYTPQYYLHTFSVVHYHFKLSYDQYRPLSSLIIYKIPQISKKCEQTIPSSRRKHPILITWCQRPSS